MHLDCDDKNFDIMDTIEEVEEKYQDYPAIIRCARKLKNTITDLSESFLIDLVMSPDIKNDYSLRQKYIDLNKAIHDGLHELNTHIDRIENNTSIDQNNSDI